MLSPLFRVEIRVCRTYLVRNFDNFLNLRFGVNMWYWNHTNVLIHRNFQLNWFFSKRFFYYWSLNDQFFCDTGLSKGFICYKDLRSSIWWRHSSLLFAVRESLLFVLTSTRTDSSSSVSFVSSSRRSTTWFIFGPFITVTLSFLPTIFIRAKIENSTEII